MVRRFWEGAIRGGYVGHGETYLHHERYPVVVQKGGSCTAPVPSGSAFLRASILEEGPSEGLNPLKSDWDATLRGYSGAVLLLLLRLQSGRAIRHFHMNPGLRYRVDVIDTWNMTIERQPGLYEGAFRNRIARKAVYGGAHDESLKLAGINDGG